MDQTPLETSCLIARVAARGSPLSWPATLARYAYPVIGDLPVQLIDTPLVLAVLKPIWTIKPETASRVRQRIEAVLGWATVHEYRTGDNPARWQNHLDKALQQKTDIRKVKHHAALVRGDWRVHGAAS